MRRGHQRAALTAVMIGSVLLTTACGSSSPSSSGGGGTSASAGPDKVAVVIKGLDNPFFQTMEQGVKEQGQKSGVKVTVQAAQATNDTSGQASKLTTLAGQNFGCFVVNPINGTNLIQGLAQIAAKGVPVVNIDSPVDPVAAKSAGLKLTTYIGTDNVAAGGLDGQHMLQVLGGSGTVGIIGGPAGDVTSNARIKGFTDAVKGKLTVLPVVPANWDRGTALTAATNLITAHPDLKGMFVANDDMALGVVRATQDAGKGAQVKVMSVDGIKDGLTSIQSGGLAATVSQYPYAIGSLGVEACQAALAGKKVPTDVKAPVALVSKDDVTQALAKFPEPFKTFADPFAASR